MSRSIILKTNSLTRSYKVGSKDLFALRAVDINVSKGTFLAVQGKSGSGKTTLLNLIGGIDRPTAGEVILDGENISRMRDSALSKIRLKKIGFIFQRFYLIPTMNALENVILPMKEGKIGRRERKKRAIELLDMMELGERIRHFPNQLSGGEQQRVAIARALANRPKIILADEPTGELDSISGDNIGKILTRINEEEKVTIIMATHDDVIAELADRKIILKDGKII